jgi:IclR family transcriptional regulator, KDG regulon repressor
VLKTRKPKTYSVPALNRSLDIIERLVTEERGLSITEVSHRFKIPKSSAFGILQTLKARGYVEKDSDDRYSLTLKIFGLGSALIDALDLRKQLYPLLKELTDKSKITGHIAVLDQGYAVYVEKVEVLGALRLTTGIGKRMQVHSTSIGKALLAYQPDSEVDRIIAERGLPRHTTRTLASAQELKNELVRVRSLGYAVSNEENEEGVRAVAAPIFNHSGKVAAAVNLGGSTLQIKMKDVPALGELVRSYAGQMSRKLGYRNSVTGSKLRN